MCLPTRFSGNSSEAVHTTLPEGSLVFKGPAFQKDVGVLLYYGQKAKGASSNLIGSSLPGLHCLRGYIQDLCKDRDGKGKLLSDLPYLITLHPFRGIYYKKLVPFGNDALFFGEKGILYSIVIV